jgi:hypothetical protein
LFFARCGGLSAPGSSFYFGNLLCHVAVGNGRQPRRARLPRAAAVLFAAGWVLATGGLLAVLRCMREPSLREGVGDELRMVAPPPPQAAVNPNGLG